MDTKIKTELLSALRGDEFKQTRNVLHNGDTGGYCCLGVLCSIQGAPDHYLRNKWQSTVERRYAAGLTNDQMVDLARRNDGGETFAQIADHIEEAY